MPFDLKGRQLAAAAAARKSPWRRATSENALVQKHADMRDPIAL
jgi:hypothetical protein